MEKQKRNTLPTKQTVTVGHAQWSTTHVVWQYEIRRMSDIEMLN